MRGWCWTLRGSIPGVVAAEAPEVAFRVAATIEAAAVFLILGSHDDIGARGHGPGVAVSYTHLTLPTKRIV